MESPPHKRIRKLVDRYLNPTKRWTRGLDVEMRGLLRKSEAGRSYYNQAIVTHRLLVSGDAASATGFEEKRLFVAVSQVSVPDRAPDRAFWARFASVVAMAAAVMFFALQPPDRLVTQSGQNTEYIGSRGGPQNTILVGLDIEGVDAQGREYEIDTAKVASTGVKQGDAIRFSYTNEVKEIGYLFVFAVQQDNDFKWYAPIPSEGQSMKIKVGKAVSLFEVDAVSPHRAGPVRIIALFTTKPVKLKDVLAMGPSAFGGDMNRLRKRIYQTLRLDRTRDTVSVRETVIQPLPHSKASDAP